MPGATPGQRVRIVQLADYAGPYAGSFIPMLAATAREAASRGYETTIWFSGIARGRPWLPDLEGLAEIRWLDDSDGPIASTRPTLQALRRDLADDPGPLILHTHFSKFDIPAALMRLGRRRSAVIWHEHTRLTDTQATKWRNVLRYTVFGPLVYAILCVSPTIREGLRARNAPARKLRDLPNAIDLGRFPIVTPPMRATARRSLGVPESARVVLHFGWDWHTKGGDLVLAAADLLGSESDVVILTVLGEQTSAEHLGLGNHQVLWAVQARTDVQTLYASADVFLSASRAEGMPYAVLEALASGLPVVASDLPVHRALLSGLPAGRTVLLDRAAIAGAITSLLSLDESERAAHAAMARGRVEAAYALDPWARRMVDLYEEALGIGPGAAGEDSPDARRHVMRAGTEA